MTKKTTNKLIRAGLALAGFAALQPTAIADAKAKPTFTEDIAPIIYNNCTECHRAGQAAPFTLKSYNDVKKRARLITKVTEDHYMPPWHPVDGHGKFVDERRLTTDELATLKNWHKTGMAEGPADKLPEPPKFASAQWHRSARGRFIFGRLEHGAAQDMDKVCFQRFDGESTLAQVEWLPVCQQIFRDQPDSIFVGYRETIDPKCTEQVA